MSMIVDKRSPFTGGPMELRTEPASVVYRGETIQYEKSFYHCVETNMEFVDEILEAANLKQVYDKYRRNHAIPLAEDLKAWRESCGIPATAMSLILGLGENQFGLYEDGVMPTPSVGKFLTLAMAPGKIMDMLLSSRNSFTDKQFYKYFSAISASLHPGEYEVENVRIGDYESVSCLPSRRIDTKCDGSSPRKCSYNEFLNLAYAVA